MIHSHILHHASEVHMANMLVVYVNKMYNGLLLNNVNTGFHKNLSAGSKVVRETGT
jgi:hypothetical protein